MTNLLGPDADRTPCGRCCPPPGQRVRVLPTDDQELLTDKCPEPLRRTLAEADIAVNGDRVLRLRPDGRCEFLAIGDTHCLLVVGGVDLRPAACRDEHWPKSACELLDCKKKG